jgi:DNA invertase Pin-like site-specific DNA recombinase
LDVRVSTDRQQHAQTIEQQVTQLRTYAAARDGWTVAEEHVVGDDGYSGAKLDRPGLDALCDQASRAAFDVVLVTAPDPVGPQLRAPDGGVGGAGTPGRAGGVHRSAV